MASMVFGQYMDKMRELYQAGRTITLKDMQLYTNQYMSPPAPKDVTGWATARVANVGGKVQKRAGYQRCNLGATCTQHNPKPTVDLSFMATEWDLLPDAK